MVQIRLKTVIAKSFLITGLVPWIPDLGVIPLIGVDTITVHCILYGRWSTVHCTVEYNSRVCKVNCTGACVP